MTINAADLVEHVIKPTLDYLGMYSSAAEKLLLGTAAQESQFDPFCHSSSSRVLICFRFSLGARGNGTNEIVGEAENIHPRAVGVP